MRWSRRGSGNKTVEITKDGTEILLSIDSTTAIVNRVEVELDSLAKIVNERTYVPVRFISEALDANVEGYKENGTVEIGFEETVEVVE